MSESKKGEAPWRKVTPLISWSNAAVLGGLIAALVLVGSLFDLRISEALFDPGVLVDPTQANPVGLFGAAFGEVPAGLSLAVAGSLLVVYRNRERTWAKLIQMIGGALMLLSGTVMVTYLPTRYLAWPSWTIYLVCGVIVLLVVLGALKLASGTDRRSAIRVAMTLFLVLITELIIVNVIKVGWERPRMRMLEQMIGPGQPDLDFNHWWQIGDDAKDAMTSSGLTQGEEFKSFPSGHTANAAMAIMLTVLPVLRASLSRWKGLLFWGGATWALYVALSRIIMGAHFLTDTMVGLTVTFGAILIAYRIAFPSKKNGLGESHH